MGRFLLTLIIAVLAVHIVILLGAMGYGWATDRFEGDKLDQYIATWQGVDLVEKPEEVEADVIEETPTDAIARIAESEIKSETLRRNLSRQVEVLRNMKMTVDMAQRKLEGDMEDFQAQKTEFLETIDQYENRVREAGFQKALKSYSSLKPKLVKNDFMQMEDEQVVRYLSAMKPDTVKKILNNFKRPDEEAKRQRILQLMETHNSVASSM
jgi:flagellar motility protein MotE (MotC chaperone)